MNIPNLLQSPPCRNCSLWSRVKDAAREFFNPSYIVEYVVTNQELDRAGTRERMGEFFARLPEWLEIHYEPAAEAWIFRARVPANQVLLISPSGQGLRAQLVDR